MDNQAVFFKENTFMLKYFVDDSTARFLVGAVLLALASASTATKVFIKYKNIS